MDSLPEGGALDVIALPDLEADAHAVVGGRHDPPCPPTVDPHTIALYLFEGQGSTLDNAAGADFQGTLHGSVASRTAGPPLCGGRALRFSPPFELQVCQMCGGATEIECPVSPQHGELPSALGRDLTEGSVDFWFFVDGPGPPNHDFGLVARDAWGVVESGHLSILLAGGVYGSGRLAVRLQGQSGDQGRCSPEPLALDAWHHVGVSFGQAGLKVFVDGVEVPPSPPEKGVPPFDWCSTVTDPITIVGNSEPWVLGWISHRTCPGTTDQLYGPLEDGAIANLRISDVARDFSDLGLQP